MSPVSLKGTTTRFSGNGRQLGYPTANLTVDTSLDDGVYFGFADLGVYQQQPALIFIGVPTTVGDKDRRVEAHLLDIPDQDYYDQPMQLSVHHFHRRNETFESIKHLFDVMKTDEVAARTWFANKIQAAT